MITAIVAGTVGSKMYKLVMDRTTGGIQVLPHSSQDMPHDGFTIAKCLTLELAEQIVREIYEFLGEHPLMVILNPSWMDHHAVEIQTFLVVPMFDQHDVQMTSNTANVGVAVHEGKGNHERIVQLIWPRTNHTFEACHLMIASQEPQPVPLEEWAAALEAA